MRVINCYCFYISLAWFLLFERFQSLFFDWLTDWLTDWLKSFLFWIFVGFISDFPSTLAMKLIRLLLFNFYCILSNFRNTIKHHPFYDLPSTLPISIVYCIRSSFSFNLPQICPRLTSRASILLDSTAEQNAKCKLLSFYWPSNLNSLKFQFQFLFLFSCVSSRISWASKPPTRFSPLESHRPFHHFYNILISKMEYVLAVDLFSISVGAVFFKRVLWFADSRIFY